MWLTNETSAAGARLTDSPIAQLRGQRQRHLGLDVDALLAGHLKDADELDEMYMNAGFGSDTRTITYCQAGVHAAFTHLVLTALGRADVRTYDGSWEEWGNDPATPVVVGRS